MDVSRLDLFSVFQGTVQTIGSNSTTLILVLMYTFPCLYAPIFFLFHLHVHVFVDVYTSCILPKFLVGTLCIFRKQIQRYLFL